MSRNSDAKQLLDLALARGLTVTRVKHGGFAITRGGALITRIPANGHGAGHWVRSARKAIEAA